MNTGHNYILLYRYANGAGLEHCSVSVNSGK
jgi:hypothetical protein